ncbi:MAG: hypothetical protein CO189_07875 [candidate division Zixibacteria bacterium CG_4_9_14_3_um_filter_46_8]|nr:MAG: hypothetical protein CO189_07875 [candidate division Zixibacteria bacterium CG_4_9_14_3_um_filter_46_8]
MVDYFLFAIDRALDILIPEQQPRITMKRLVREPTLILWIPFNDRHIVFLRLGGIGAAIALLGQRKLQSDAIGRLFRPLEIICQGFLSFKIHLNRIEKLSGRFITDNAIDLLTLSV